MVVGTVEGRESLGFWARPADGKQQNKIGNPPNRKRLPDRFVMRGITNPPESMHVTDSVYQIFEF